MSIFTQDQLKQTDLALVLIEKNPQLQQMLKQIVLRLGIKKSYSFNSVDEFLHAPERPKFDVLLLDLPDAETLSGGDWVDQLVFSRVLTPKQQLILFCQASTHNVLPLEYPYHNVACLSHPFTHAQIESTLKEFLFAQAVLRPIQCLSHDGRFSDALKLVQFQLSKPHPTLMLNTLKRLQIQLLSDTHQLSAHSPSLKPWLAQHDPWALWAQFKCLYDSETPASCIELLLKAGTPFNKFAERRDSYLIYLHLLTGNTNTAYQIASHIPASQLTPRLMRLVHMAFVLSGHAEDAMALLERKRRINSRGKPWVICNLMQARALLFRIHRLNFAHQAPDQCLQTTLQQLLESTQADAAAQDHQDELLLVEADLARMAGDLDHAAYLIRALDTDKQHAMMVPVWCHAAILAAALGQTAYCLQSIWLAHRSAYHAADGCQRIYGLCLLQQTLQLIPEQQRELAPLLELAEQQGDLWAAAELAYLSLSSSSQWAELTRLLKPLGFSRVHGIDIR